MPPTAPPIVVAMMRTVATTAVVQKVFLFKPNILLSVFEILVDISSFSRSVGEVGNSGGKLSGVTASGACAKPTA